MLIRYSQSCIRPTWSSTNGTQGGTRVLNAKRRRQPTGRGRRSSRRSRKARRRAAPRWRRGTAKWTRTSSATGRRTKTAYSPTSTMNSTPFWQRITQSFARSTWRVRCVSSLRRPFVWVQRFRTESITRICQRAASWGSCETNSTKTSVPTRATFRTSAKRATSRTRTTTGSKSCVSRHRVCGVCAPRRVCRAALL